MVYTKLNEPGYSSVVAVNTASSVLAKVGGFRGVIVGKEISIVVSYTSVEGYTADVSSLPQSNASEYKQMEAARWKARRHMVLNRSNRLSLEIY